MPTTKLPRWQLASSVARLLIIVYHRTARMISWLNLSVCRLLLVDLPRALTIKLGCRGRSSDRPRGFFFFALSLSLWVVGDTLHPLTSGASRYLTCSFRLCVPGHGGFSSQNKIASPSKIPAHHFSLAQVHSMTGLKRQIHQHANHFLCAHGAILVTLNT